MDVNLADLIPEQGGMPSTPARCKYCNKTLKYVAYSAPWAKRIHYAPEKCDCGGEEAERRRREEESLATIDGAARGIDARGHLIRCGVPELYAGVEPEFEVAESVRSGDGKTGLYIVGDVGRGKTTLACAIMAAKTSQAPNAWSLPKMRFTSMPDLFTRIRATYSGGGESEKSVIDEHSNVDLLVLDDLGKGSCNDWALNIVYQIVDNRVGNRLPTVVTTQYSVDALGSKLSRNAEQETADAIVSRLVGSCRAKLLDGPDLRMVMM